LYIYEIVESEQHPAYQKLAVENGLRQYDFLRSIVEAAAQLGRPFLSQSVLKALNFQAITCLHTNAGEYRPCEVAVGTHQPPARYRVQALMDDFVNYVNRNWEQADAVVLAAYVLWRLNYIHPFINGNGRTARAACYFVICLKIGVWLPGQVILPELISQNRDIYYAALQQADESHKAGQVDLQPLIDYLSALLDQQLSTAEVLVNPDSESKRPEPQV